MEFDPALHALIAVHWSTRATLRELSEKAGLPLAPDAVLGRLSVHPVLRMPVGDSWIAAPTAAILYQFRELCIGGRPTRVAHFEQPLFARK